MTFLPGPNLLSFSISLKVGHDIPDVNERRLVYHLGAQLNAHLLTRYMNGSYVQDLLYSDRIPKVFRLVMYDDLN